MFLRFKNPPMLVNMNNVEYIYMTVGGAGRPEYTVNVVFTSGNNLTVGRFTTKKEAEGFMEALIKQSDVKPKTLKEK